MGNIDIFRALSGLIFAKAYDSFPLKISIVPGEIAVQLGDEFWDESQEEVAENQFNYIRNRSPAGLAKPTIEWLIGAGFLSCDGFSDGKFVGVCLTAKGLESIESSESRGNGFIKAVAELAKDEMKEQARSQLAKLFSEALSWSIANVPTIVNSISKYGAN